MFLSPLAPHDPVEAEASSSVASATRYKLRACNSSCLECPLEQVGDPELHRPLTKIIEVELVRFALEDSEHIPPLILGKFTALPVPIEFGKQSVPCSLRMRLEARSRINWLQPPAR